MSSFLRYVRQMLVYRLTIGWAMAFACISALSMGAGLLTLAPALSLILNPDQSKSLPSLARDFNKDSDFWIEIPSVLIDRLPDSPYNGVMVIVGVIVILTIIGAAANFLHRYLSFVVITRTVARVRQQAFRHVINLPLGRVVERGPTEFIARIVRDASELQNGLIALTSKAVAQVTKGIAAFVVALIIQPKLTLITLIIVPLMGVVLKKLGKRIRRGSRGAMQAQEGLLRISTEMIQGLRAVKASTGEAEATRRFHQQNMKAVHEEMQVRTVRSMSGPLVETLALIFLGALAVLAARQIISGAMAFEQFILALGSLAIAGASFKPLAGLINEMHAADAPAARLLEITDEQRESQTTSRHRPLPRHQHSIELDNLSFTYPGANVRALDEVSVRINHGERIAIVGPNGSGKTTLLAMIPRLLRPNSGRILIDGIDIESVSLRSLRRQIGVVTQETVLFRGSVAENITFGTIAVSREQVIEAAKQAHAHDFIERIPNGYEANIYEQGASLSGGQRQRIAIARAILRDPSILILDEATSQIDAESEAHINAALKEFCQGRTSLIIAHRLSTVLGADRIVVMDSGRVVAVGTHRALLQECELYHSLTNTQLTER